MKSFFRQAVQGRKNIVVSGGTSSGKTTFVNALLKEIPRHERLILIEDAAEVKVEHPNALGLLAVKGETGEARVTAGGERHTLGQFESLLLPAAVGAYGLSGDFELLRSSLPE